MGMSGTIYQVHSEEYISAFTYQICYYFSYSMRLALHVFVSFHLQYMRTCSLFF